MALLEVVLAPRCNVASGTSRSRAARRPTVATRRPGGTAAAVRVEDRHQPTLELRRPRASPARQPGRRHAGRRARSPGDLQQVAGVVAGPRAGQQHDVVAGPLALDPHTTRGRPRQRVKPVARAGRASGRSSASGSRAGGCAASSCNRTSRRRSMLQEAVSAGSRTTGRIQPQVIGTAPWSLCSKATRRLRPSVEDSSVRSASPCRRRRSAGPPAPIVAARSVRPSAPTGRSRPRRSRPPTATTTTGRTVARMERPGAVGPLAASRAGRRTVGPSFPSPSSSLKVVSTSGDDAMPGRG